MTFAAAATRANHAIQKHMGVSVWYVVGTARRRITATPGDIQAQAFGAGGGIEVRSTCPWLVRDAELRPILGKDLPKRGHRIEVENPTTGTEIWTIEYPIPDQVDGWTLNAVLSKMAAIGAPNAEAVR